MPAEPRRNTGADPAVPTASTAPGTPAAPGAPRRRNARTNRERILAAARTELARNPDVPMDDLARAAGVVRRTVYGHFPSREALIAGLADEAAHEVATAVDAVLVPGETIERTVARFTLAAARTGDRYRLLIAFGQRNLGDGGIPALLEPIRRRSAELLAEGQREGVFGGHLPPAALASAIEGLCLALLQTGNDGEPVSAADCAVAALVAAGVPAGRAAEIVADIARDPA